MNKNSNVSFKRGIEMLNRQNSWWYVNCNTGVFVNNFNEFQKRKSELNFFPASFESEGKIEKPTIKLAYCIKKLDLNINLRVSCYLRNGNITTELFASFSGVNNSYEYFKKFFKQEWVDVSQMHFNNGSSITYINTKELSSQKHVEDFVDRINRFEHLPKDLNQEFRIACGLPAVQSLYSLSMFVVSKLDKKDELLERVPKNLAVEIKTGFN